MPERMGPSQGNILIMLCNFRNADCVLQRKIFADEFHRFIFAENVLRRPVRIASRALIEQADRQHRCVVDHADRPGEQRPLLLGRARPRRNQKVKIERHRTFEAVAIQMPARGEIAPCRVVSHAVEINGDAQIGERRRDQVLGLKSPVAPSGTWSRYSLI
jgi:hypothetical protein